LQISNELVFYLDDLCDLQASQFLDDHHPWQCSECCPFIFRMWRYFDIALRYRFVYIIYLVKIISSNLRLKQTNIILNFHVSKGCFRTRSRANLFFVQEVVFSPSDWYINYLFKNTSLVSNSISNYNTHARFTSK
jgi:hypothetical protein